MKLTVWHEGPSAAGSYSVRWYNPTTGEKERRLCLTFREMQEFKTEKKLELESHRTGKPNTQITPLVIFEEYLASLALTHRPSTVRIKRSALVPFLETLFSMDDLTEVRINKWIQDMKSKPYKPDTISLNLRELRCFVRWGLRARKLLTNPMDQIEIPSSTFVGRKLSDDEMKKIMAIASGDFKLFLFVACETGARRGEILKAQFKDFDWQRAAWKIPKENSKTKRERTIPLSDELLQTLKERSVEAPEGSILNDHGSTWAFKRWKKVLKEAGIKDRVRIHDLRHTFASNWRGRGESLKAMCGWTTNQMLSHYTHLTLDDLREDLIKSKKLG